MTVIGIDPGVKTGFAIRRSDGVLTDARTYHLWQLWEAIEEARYVCGGDITVVVEDARKRKWFGGNGKEQGAGWVKTLCGQIEEYLKIRDIPYKMIHPIKGGTKLTANIVQQITGYDQKTNEHERDAIMIAWSHK